MKFPTRLAGWIAGVALAAGIGLGHAQEPTPAVEEVIKLPTNMVTQAQGQLAPMTNEVIFPDGIRIQTNGVFQVNKGKERTLAEGQRLRRDGLLQSPNGSLVPVVDHVTIQKGKVWLVQDGTPQPLAKETTLGDGSRIRPDGAILPRAGTLRRLIEGQWLRLDGKPITTQDTITLKDGVVWVQKEGALFKLQPRQTIVMNDGTRVSADGSIVSRNGITRQLKPNETILIEGVRTR